MASATPPRATAPPVANAPRQKAQIKDLSAGAMFTVKLITIERSQAWYRSLRWHGRSSGIPRLIPHGRMRDSCACGQAKSVLVAGYLKGSLRRAGGGGENGDRKHNMESRFGGRLWARLDPLMVLALCFQSTRPYSSHVKFYQAISLMNSNCSCFAKSPPATA